MQKRTKVFKKFGRLKKIRTFAELYVTKCRETAHQHTTHSIIKH